MGIPFFDFAPSVQDEKRLFQRAFVLKRTAERVHQKPAACFAQCRRLV